VWNAYAAQRVKEGRKMIASNRQCWRIRLYLARQLLFSLYFLCVSFQMSHKTFFFSFLSQNKYQCNIYYYLSLERRHVILIALMFENYKRYFFIKF